jgi:predicted transcriptional regulator
MRKRLIKELARLEDYPNTPAANCEELAKLMNASGRQAVNRPLNALEQHGVVTHDSGRPRNYKLTDIGRILLAVID